jgi:hypothetical protein
MKRSTLFVFLGLAALVSSAEADVINFDDVTGPVGLSNQYASHGVIFDTIEATPSFPFNVMPPSSPNYATPFWNTTNPGAIEFVSPLDSSVLAYTDSVTLTMVGLTSTMANPGNFSGATIEALDVFGNVIAGQTQVIPATSASTLDLDLTFTGQVHELVFTPTGGTSGVLPFDNLTFDSPTAVPEPSSAVLLIGCLAGFALFARGRIVNLRRQ